MLELLDGGRKPGGAPAETGPASALLVDLNARLEAAAGTQDPKARLGALGQLQDTGAAPCAALLAQYLFPHAGTHAGREVLWASLLGYQTRLTQALCAAAGASLTLLGAARALRAIRALAKLHLVHYAAVPGRLWRVAYAIHAGAEKAGFATTPVHAQADHRAATTVEQELLRLVMLRVSAPDMMPPEQVEVADRVVEHLGAEFTLRQPGVADNPFCYEPAAEHPPRRARGRELPDTTRYFGPGMGYESLERIARQFGGAKPADFRAFGNDIAPRVQLGAVNHLLAFWRVDAPYVPPEHSPASGSLEVVHGYAQVWQHASQPAQAAGGLSLADYAGPPQPPETWEVRGKGGSELGVEVPPASRAWAKCGTLLGLSTGDGERWTGLIRRMHPRADGGLQADIAVLSRAPRATELREVIGKYDDGAVTEAVARQFGTAGVKAVILADGGDGAQPANLLVPSDHWSAGGVYELQQGDASRYLRTTQAVRHGEDYVRATFEWVAGPG
ncbi:MAG: hypothetical protein OEV81_08160 [Betaproteobacteria bacterium]|nr:hypothetical protein [Betaproteobacteria bacterium]MDH5222256.1 hypothetical protein [Betaproteobacteria bacterium]MDH5350958.1 hypothetical protein [Betaproteobacteria bacterium]